MTSPEVRAELEKAGWTLEKGCSPNYECWHMGFNQVELYNDGTMQFRGLGKVFFQFAAIAGIAPQGYRVVKE